MLQIFARKEHNERAANWLLAIGATAPLVSLLWVLLG